MAERTHLVFRIEDRRLAIPVSQVRRIYRAVSLTPLPGAPPDIEGVVDIHGEMVPVLDLRPRLGLAPRPLQPGDRLLLTVPLPRPLALRVDATEDLHDLVPLPLQETGLATDPAPGGLARLPDGLVLILDPDRYLRIEDDVALERSLAALEAP